jgi:hypothetical protein
MSIVIPALGVACAAFVVWLIVRRVNRRERWTMWAIVIVVGVPAIYVISFGPACWFAARFVLSSNPAFTQPSSRISTRLYAPIWWAINRRRIPVVSEALAIYGVIGIPRGGVLEIPSQEGDFWEDHIWVR